MRKTGKKRSIMEFVGIWADKKDKVENMRKMIEEDRRKFKLREVKF